MRVCASLSAIHQGPRSNFEMGGGGGGPLVTRYLGGTGHHFLLTLYNSAVPVRAPKYSLV